MINAAHVIESTTCLGVNCIAFERHRRQASICYFQIFCKAIAYVNLHRNTTHLELLSASLPDYTTSSPTRQRKNYTWFRVFVVFFQSSFRRCFRRRFRRRSPRWVAAVGRATHPRPTLGPMGPMGLMGPMGPMGPMGVGNCR